MSNFIYLPLFVLLGLFTGSFLNVCIDRLPRRESIAFPPSHCDNCGKKLAPVDLVPVFSYLLLSGKCRYCKRLIPLRIPLVELITATMFGLFLWRFGLSIELAFFLVTGCLLIMIFVIDLENQLVLNVITFPAMIIMLIFSLFRPEMPAVDSLGSGVIIETVTSFTGTAFTRLVIALAGGAAGLLIMSLPYIIYPKGMGLGDIKLAALVGIMTGYPLVILAIIMSWILGGIIAIILLAFKIKGRKDAIPAAVFMTVAALITLLWGQSIWAWYLP